MPLTRGWQFCWFLAGRVLGRFLKAAQDVNSIQQIDTLEVELEFIRLVCSMDILHLD